jgi:hypothetical protein
MTTRHSVTTSIHEHGMVLFDITRGRLFSANRTGARIWQQLEHDAPDEAIASDLSEAYGLPLDTAREHARRFILSLEAEGLIERGQR